ncbi:MAG: RNase adapter RapZ [Clostridiales bacterium]|nr:RNase adapter RapZ [Clostridiales bacterium]
MNFIIISGQSGAGKSQAKKVFEDLGFYCVDNLPPSLIPSFIELLEQSSENISNIALVIDIRGGKFFKDLENNLNLLKSKEYPYKIFYFEANDDVILKRFKETRRTHPLDPSGRIEDAIKAEKDILETLKNKADYVINTSTTNQAELKNEISRYLEIDETENKITLTLISFGFKKGVPLDSDFVFDVRFLPNPFYIESLRGLTGNDASVSDYVLGFEESNTLMVHIKNLLDYSLSCFEKDGRMQLVVSIGCTGGQHRSVTFINALAKHFDDHGYNIKVVHRDIKKEA